MEEVFVKPGNQERGWNDPPQFSYSLQTTGPRRTPLKHYSPGAGAQVLTPPLPPGSAPPPQGQAPPPRIGTPTSSLKPMVHQGEPGSSQSDSELDVESVVSVLSQALTACRHSVTGQVCDDIAKRLCLLETNWRSGLVSLPVRRRMSLLAQEVQSCRWDSADELHRSLMVDHVTEVSQWMVGVKRLIAETRNLDPQLLDSTLNSTSPSGDSP